MNEIERALATLQDLLDNSIFTSRIDFALEVAIEALREKQEREKGCAVCSCEYHQELCAEVVRYHSSDFATQEKVDVHYCPVCGRRLEVEHGE